MLFQNGIKYLRKTLLNNASNLAKIQRGTAILHEQVSVVLARSEFENNGDNGKRYTTYLVDVLISSELNYRPVKGDKITVDSKVYLVRAIDNEVYRYDDPYKTMIRVHVMQAGGLV